MQEIQQAEKMKIQMIIVKLLIIGALFIISNQNIHLMVPSEREIFLDSYSGWITDIIDKIVNITGHAVRLEWLPKQYL